MLRARALQAARVALVAPLVLFGAPAASGRQQAPASAGGTLDPLLPRRGEVIYRALATRYQPERPMDLVTYMDRFWRLAGNRGYNASLDRIRAGLLDAGFRERPRPASTETAVRPSVSSRAPAAGAGAFWFEEFPNGGNGWEFVRAEMTLAGSPAGVGAERVFDPERDRVALCINSFSTPPGGTTAPLVYVGMGTGASDYEGVSARGAIVLGDGPVRELWEQAVRARGALGVISAAPPAPYAKPDESPDVFQWGSVPYDEALQAFGFKASREVAERLKRRIRAGATTATVVVETRFQPSPGRSLVAEIPGTVRPDERVVLVAHVQEPGANDNASGCATLLEIARALAAAIAAKALTPPSRTLTLVWGDEIRASREWLKAEPDRALGVRYMFSLDMTGEDTATTGGSFLIEKEPDPSAVWDRPSDPHTEWGPGSYEATALKGSLLNDLLLAVCQRRARDTGWVVRTNPYEGGSDHSVFLAAGVPAVLVWHFPDRYYHTNLDRPDKTSPAEMEHVGIAVGTTAMLLASSGEVEAEAVTELVERAALGRLDLEEKQADAIVGSASDRATAAATERTVFEAWRRWYTEALEGVLHLPVSPAGTRLRARVRAAVERVNARRSSAAER
jgi:aminopeptidase YwaD